MPNLTVAEKYLLNMEISSFLESKREEYIADFQRAFDREFRGSDSNIGDTIAEVDLRIILKLFKEK